MVGKGDGVAEVGYGFQAGRVEDVVDAEGGEFADVGVADAPPAFDEGVFQSVFDFAVGVGEGCVVEVAAEDDGMGGVGDVAVDLCRLAGAPFVGPREAGDEVAGAVRELVAVDALPDFFHERAFFFSEAEGFQVDGVEADGVFGGFEVAVDTGGAVGCGEGEVIVAQDFPTGEDCRRPVDVMVGVGVQPFDDGLFFGASGFEVEFLQADEVAAVGVEVAEQFGGGVFVVGPAVGVEIADVVGEDGQVGFGLAVLHAGGPVVGREGGYPEEGDGEDRPCRPFPAEYPVGQQAQVGDEEVRVCQPQQRGQRQDFRVDE